jgi:multiple sugar transport system substrate-binding protein
MRTIRANLLDFVAGPEEEQLMADPIETRPVARRTVLKGLALSAGLVSVPAIIAACSPAASTAPSVAAPSASAAAPSASAAAPSSAAPSAATGSLTLGSYHTDTQGEKDGMAAVDAAFTTATGIPIKYNLVDHTTFQNSITSYLNATPDDAFTWFSGYRMRFFAAQGLATPIDDVWAKVTSNFSAGFKAASTGDDSKTYLIPTDYYPWAVFYRKSVFADKGYTIPATWDDLKALCAQMQKDGLIPFAFADVEGWPAMGTFDILNLRINGYDFHVGLMAGTEKWTDAKVTAVFQAWTEILPFHQDAATGRKWVDAAATLVQKKAGMYLLGLFVSGAFTDPADLADLDFFPYPSFGNAYDAEKALDAPIDGYMISAKSPNLAADLDAAKAYLEFWAMGSTQSLFLSHAPGNLAVANDADVSKYSALQTKAVQVVGDAQKVAQFLDRDTRPDFAGANGMQAFLLTFLKDPKQDLTKLQGQIQQFWDALPPTA